jgi:hypothetical protein
MIIDDNVQPINMFRINRAGSLKLPNISDLLGPISTEFFLSELQGYDFVLTPNGSAGGFNSPVNLQPFINGQKLGFKPATNFESRVLRTIDITGSVEILFQPQKLLRRGNQNSAEPGLKNGAQR